MEKLLQRDIQRSFDTIIQAVEKKELYTTSDFQALIEGQLHIVHLKGQSMGLSKGEEIFNPLT